MRLENWARSGMAIGLYPKEEFELSWWRIHVFSKSASPPEIYCQSKHSDNRPRPSFPLEPPKIRVKSVDF